MNTQTWRTWQCGNWAIRSQKITTAQKRSWWIAGGLALLLLIMVLRLLHLTLRDIQPEDGIPPALHLQGRRADIVDRHGVLLATSLPTFSVYVHPHRLTHPQKMAQQLKKVFPRLQASKLQELLSSNRKFVWIKRHITPGEKQRVMELGIPGIHILEDSKRKHVHGRLFAHALGVVGIDNKGLSGLERGLEKRLYNVDSPLQTSFDIRAQHIVYQELKKSIAFFKAKGGNAILADVQKGEVLASVSLSDFDPEKRDREYTQNLANRNLLSYEFGSLMKIHNVAIALEKRIATLASMYDASSPLRIGRFSVNDFRGKRRPMSVEEGFMFSSNLVNAKLALKLGAEQQKQSMQEMGLLSPLQSELFETGKTLTPCSWNNPTVITLSYGYGLAMTAMHMVQSVSSVVEGSLKPLTFLKSAPDDVQKKRLFSPSTIKNMRHILYRAAQEGQAKNARVKGIQLGAKTGTANIIGPSGRYLPGKNITSAISVFPIHQPKYILFVCLDQPQARQETHGYTTAGWIAAPLASKIVGRLAGLFGLAREEKMA